MDPPLRCAVAPRAGGATRVVVLAAMVATPSCGPNATHAPPAPPTANAPGAGGGSAGGSGGTSTTASGGGGTTMACDDCSADADCNGTSCVELWPGGFHTCASGETEATGCTGNALDECCTTADCAMGACYPVESPQDAPGQPYNVCFSDACASDADCARNGLQYRCVPAHTFGFPVRHCEQMFCATSADCTEASGGCCAPVRIECEPKGSLPYQVVLNCVYPDGCRSNADCSADEPPFDVGESYCDSFSASCAEVLQGTWCAP